MNPLISSPELPYGAPPLDQIKDDHFLPAFLWSIAKGREKITEICGNVQTPDFENTIAALEFATDDFTRISHIFENMCGSQTNDELQKIEETVSVEQSKFYSEISMNAPLFRRIEVVYQNHSGLTQQQSRLLEETYKGFVHSGALLAAKEQERLKQINERLSELTTHFQNNETKSRALFRCWITHEAELDGIPERAKNIYRQQAQLEGDAKGAYLLLLDPHPADVLIYGKNRALRQEIYKAVRMLCCDGEYDNRPIILEILRLRYEKAQLLGYRNHADYILSDRMARNTETVQAFLEKNLKTYKTAAEKELQEIRDYALATDGITDFKPWDLAYYQNCLREKRFDFETELLRPYFGLENVLLGARQHAERLFNIEFREEKTGIYPVYHPDVKIYEVYDNKTKNIIGLFYADYFARSGTKRSGAWMGVFRDRGMIDGKDCIPLISNNCNFDKPVPGQPALLSIDDVKTLFHEFGHALHGLLSVGDYASLNGTNVKRDFVELPSQVMENWVVEPEILASFARHYETGEIIPADYIQKIKDSENFCVGLFGLRQTFFALLDMTYHTLDPAKIISVETVEEEIAERAVLIPPEFGLMSASFTHIFAGGYDAGYYGYKWAEVMDADVFARFKQRGLYDATLSQKLRASIFSRGNTVEPTELYKEMMGQEPDADALFRREGLLSNQNKY